MPDQSSTLHSVSGLDDRDLALLAAACADRANYLTHLAAGRYNHTGYHAEDPNRASHDADRLNYIATTLTAAVKAAVSSRMSPASCKGPPLRQLDGTTCWGGPGRRR